MNYLSGVRSSSHSAAAAYSAAGALDSAVVDHAAADDDYEGKVVNPFSPP